jgi:ferritin heavy chain
LANSHHDPHLSDYLKDEFINERAEVINRLAQYVTNLERVGDGLGVYIMDKDLQ